MYAPAAPTSGPPRATNGCSAVVLPFAGPPRTAHNAREMVRGFPPFECRAASCAGFTLIEALVAVAVLAILTSVALPSFMDSIRKGRRADAVAALAAVQQAQERWRSNRNAYTTELTAEPDDDPPGLALPDASAKGYYAITVDDADATGFTTTASAVAGSSQASDGPCARLRIRVDGGNVFYGSAAVAGDFDESAANPCWAR